MLRILSLPFWGGRRLEGVGLAADHPGLAVLEAEIGIETQVRAELGDGFVDRTLQVVAKFVGVEEQLPQVAQQVFGPLAFEVGEVFRSESLRLLALSPQERGEGCRARSLRPLTRLSYRRWARRPRSEGADIIAPIVLPAIWRSAVDPVRQRQSSKVHDR